MVGKLVIGTTLGVSLFLNSSCVSLHLHKPLTYKPHYYPLKKEKKFSIYLKSNPLYPLQQEKEFITISTFLENRPYKLKVPKRAVELNSSLLIVNNQTHKTKLIYLGNL